MDISVHYSENNSFFVTANSHGKINNLYNISFVQRNTVCRYMHKAHKLNTLFL